MPASDPQVGGGGSSAAGSSRPREGDSNDPFDAAIESYGPLLQEAGIGGAAGLVTGLATKKIGEWVAVVLGTGFITLQALNYTGYVKVNWDKAKKDAIKAMDADGDGRFTIKDVKAYWKRFQHVMTFGLPSSAGFGMGFLIGLQH